MTRLTKKTSSLPRLKNAFTAFLRTQPLEQITVQSIVRKADANRLTFYRHLLDRDDFLRTCLDTLTFDLILVKLDQKQEFLIHEKLCTPL